MSYIDYSGVVPGLLARRQLLSASAMACLSTPVLLNKTENGGLFVKYSRIFHFGSLVCYNCSVCVSTN